MSEGGSDAIDTGVIRGLTAFQLNVLVVLAEGDDYGLGIKRKLEAYYGDSVNHGRLYPNLDELVELDLIEKGQLDRRTNEYRLTEAGLGAIFDRLAWIVSKLRTDDDRAERLYELLEE